MPFYVSPEQMMKDRADYARKGIGRGRSVAVLQYADGVLFVSENPSQALHKISEIYDRIAFAAVGRYNEFENLRIAGVRLADMRGYSYDRRDVTGRGLANAYAQTLGAIFSSGAEKPYEVEIFVAELGVSSAEDQVFRLTYDGQVADEQGYAAMGGQAESVTSYLAERWTSGLSLTEALRLAVAALGHGEADDRRIPVSDLEAAVLDRTRSQQRKFRRLDDVTLAGALGPDGGPDGGPDRGPDGDSGPADPGPTPVPTLTDDAEPAAPSEPPVAPVLDSGPSAAPTASPETESEPDPRSVAEDTTPSTPQAPAPDPEPVVEAEPVPVVEAEPLTEPEAVPVVEPEHVIEPDAPSVAEPDDRADLWPPVAPPPEPEPAQPRADRPPPPPGVAGTAPEPTYASEGELGDDSVEQEWSPEETGGSTAEPAEGPESSEESENPENSDDADEERTDGEGWHPFWRGDRE
ncbi:proteasome subunit alpha [Marmoricola endophyticus]